jgi:ABC-2 type transport system ATP-binding protein
MLLELQHYTRAFSAYPFGDSVHLHVIDDSFEVTDLEVYLNGKGLRGFEITAISAGVEDCFMYLMEKHHTHA